MSQDARLTVAVLSRNRPRYVEQMLNALLVPTRDAEVVVRDHSDDDRCEQLVVRMAAQNPGFRLTHIHARPRGQLENVLGAIDDCRMVDSPSTDGSLRRSWRVTGCTMLRFRLVGAISTGSASRCMSFSTTRPSATARTNFGLHSTPMSAAPSLPASWVGTGHQNTSTVHSPRHRAPRTARI